MKCALVLAGISIAGMTAVLTTAAITGDFSSTYIGAGVLFASWSGYALGLSDGEEK